MADQHFVIDTTKPHAKKVARLVRDCNDIMDTAAHLKSIADEVTSGGVNLDSADFLALFGLPSAEAGAALYPLLQAIMSGSLVKASFVEFDQGL